MKQNKRWAVIGVFFIWLVTACSTGQVKSSQAIDLSNPSQIKIEIATYNDSARTNSLEDQVAKNLQTWHFPVTHESTLPASHLLTVLIGVVEHGSTPAGFSFSPGNSDPRALEFQKADVLPITCRLTPTNHPDQSAELNMGFSDSLVNGPKPNLTALSDHISTVCFNLLREIVWPIKQPKGEVIAGGNSWMPEIRIETEEEAEKIVSPKSTETTKVEAAQPIEKREPSKPVTKEIIKEGRKVYIIHNHGNPITFKFGNDRK
jgi:hypothetical protein